MAELEEMGLEKYENFGEHEKMWNNEALNYTPFRKKKKEEKSKKSRLSRS